MRTPSPKHSVNLTGWILALVLVLGLGGLLHVNSSLGKIASEERALQTLAEAESDALDLERLLSERHRALQTQDPARAQGLAARVETRLGEIEAMDRFGGTGQRDLRRAQAEFHRGLRRELSPLGTPRLAAQLSRFEQSGFQGAIHGQADRLRDAISSARRRLAQQFGIFTLIAGALVLFAIYGGSRGQVRRVDLLEDRARRITKSVDEANTRLDEERAKVRRSMDVLDRCGRGIVGLDPAARVTSWNRGAEDLFGLDLQITQGQDVSHRFEGKDRERFLDRFDRLAGEKPLPPFVATLRRGDGQRFLAECALESLHGPDGTFAGGVMRVHDVTESRSREREHRENQRLLQASHPGRMRLDAEGRLVSCNSTVESWIGAKRAVHLLGHPLFELVDDGDRALVAESFATGSLERNGALRFRLIAHGGQRLWLEARFLERKAPGGAIADLRVFLRQVGTEMGTQQALEDLEQRFRLVSTGANDALWDWNLSSGQVHYSSRWCELLGRDESTIAGRLDSWLGHVHEEDLDDVRAALERLQAGEVDVIDLPHRLRHEDGRTVWVRGRVIADRDAGGKVLRIGGSLTDVTQRQHVEQQIHHENYYDRVTELPNRTLLLDRVQHCLAIEHRRNDYGWVLLVLDLDRFHRINDCWGDSTGDKVLRQVALRLNDSLRPGDTLACLGGDVFALLLDEVLDPTSSVVVVERLHKALSDPFEIEGQLFHTRATVGGTSQDGEYDTPDEALRDARIAMAKAKGSHRGGFLMFDPTMHSDALQRVQLESEIRCALACDELFVRYQPILSIESGDWVGVEALLRWQHPERGELRPDQFLHIAEESSLMAEIESFVIRRACEEVVDWGRRDPAWNELELNVNLSSELREPERILAEIDRTLVRTRIDPSRLSLEFTESAVVDHVEIRDFLVELEDRGIQARLDDVGVGYSSLRFLDQLNFAGIKIDGSFISRIERTDRSYRLIATITDLAHKLEIGVTAEGVETLAQLEAIRSLGCDRAQGHLLSVPLASADVLERLQTPFAPPREDDLDRMRRGA